MNTVAHKIILNLIESNAISKAFLAKEMDMPYGTFKNKLSIKQSAYRFSDKEGKKLLAILSYIALNIQDEVRKAKHLYGK